MLELIDKLLFSRLNQIIFPNHLKVLISCDHSTPCKNKAHSADPVPVLYYVGDYSEIKSQKFSEKDSKKKGELGNIDTGKELFKKTNFL
jgi:2,3-bisphosphoglycerate-independent phosphoglycerate mutase